MQLGGWEQQGNTQREQACLFQKRPIYLFQNLEQNAMQS